MPGTLLLDDWKQSVQDELNRHVQDALSQAQQAAASIPSISAPQIQAPEAPQIDPQAVLDQLNQHVQGLVAGATQAAQPAVVQVNQATQPATQSLNDVNDQLQQHVQGVIGGTFGGEAPVTATTPTPEAAPQASNQGAVITTPPAAATADVSGAPSSDTTSSDTTQTSPTRVGQGQSAFIQSLQPLAAKVAARTGIDPNVMIAIAANETGWGQSSNAKDMNNLFSLQGDGSNGSRWASYTSPEQSFQAFSDLIQNSPRYAQAWADRADPAKFVGDLRNAGYVVDEPGYPAQGWVDQVNSINTHLPPVTGTTGTSTTQGVNQPIPQTASDWLDLAKQQLGKPYIWGSAGGRSDFSPTAAGFDCSGFVSYVYKDALGINLPAQTESAYAATKPIGGDQALPGDVVLYNMDNPDPHIQHIAIYIGNGQVIQAGGGVDKNVNIAPIGQAGNYEFRRAAGAETAIGNAAATQHVATQLGSTAATQTTPTKVTTVTQAQAPPVVRMGENQPATTPIAGGQSYQGPTPIQTAQDAVSGVVGDIQRAGQQAIATLGGAADQARSAAGQAIGGAASAVGTTANQIGGELQQQGGAAGQALQSSGQDVAAAAQRVPPVLGGAASNLGSAASQTAQELGSSGAANALLRQGRTQQEEDEFAQQQQQQAAQIVQQAKTNPPVIGGPGDVARNVWDLVTNSSPGLPGVSLVDYQHASTVKNDWIQQNNPVYNLPGGRPGEGQTTPASVLGDLTTQIAQQITDPYSMTMFGLTGGVGGKVIGGAAGEATTAAATDQLGEAGAKFLGTVVDKLVSGGITGGVQNALYEAEQPGADPAAVGIAALQGAGFGGVMDLGLSAAKPLMRRIGQTIIDNAPQIRPAVAEFARSEVGAVGRPEDVQAERQRQVEAGQRELPGTPAPADTAVRAQQGVDNPVDLRQSQRAGRLVNTLGEDIGPNDTVTVYHATTPEVAASLVENGFQPGAKTARDATTVSDPSVARMLGKNVGDPLDYEPGRGQGQGVYFTTDPRAARDVYGSAIVAIDVPRSALEVPPERQTPRMTPERSLLLGDGYTTQPISPDQVRLVNTGGVPIERPGPATAATRPTAEVRPETPVARAEPAGFAAPQGRPAEAEATGWRTYNSAFSGKPDEFRPHPDDINVTPSTPGAVFRGLTADEAASIQSRGVVKSTGAYSHPSEGTSFAPDFATAESTINYGRDNPSRTGRPTYVIEVSDGPDLAVDRRDGWPKAQAPIPTDRITRVWRFEPDGTSRVGTTSLLERPSSPAPATVARAEPTGFRVPEAPAADVRGTSGVPGVGGGTPPPETGFRAPVTPDDLNVRPVSQAEARQLVGPAYDPSTRTTQRPPGEGESPRRLEDVESNPHLLREPAEGETPMTTDERQAHQDNVVERYQTNQDRLAAIQEQLDNPKAKPERPPWAAGFTNDQVATMAAKAGRSPYEPLWWEKAGLESGSGEVREMLNESGVNRGDLNAQREPSPAELRQEQRALEQDQRHLEAAGEQLATAPDDARFAKPPDRNAAPLPFEHTTADPGAELAQQVVLKKGTLTSDPNQVTATRSDTGITGRGIVNPAEVVHEPPSAETKALMPNLSAIGKDMPETVAQIQKSVEDNPQLWEHYRQGTISFDSLKNDLARRVGMTKEDWLKTKVGQAFNDREMVALQAAMVEEEARQTDLAKSIMAKGGVDALTPEELAYSMASFTEAQSLAAVAKGAGSTSGRSLNARKVSFTRQLASDITAANEWRAAQRTKTQATRVASRADDLLQNAKTLDQQKAVATAAASRPGQAGAPRAPKSIIDQIAQAYDELDRYNALSLHEKASVFDKLQEQRAAQAAARAAKVRGAPEELLSALKKELQWEQNNFAKRKDTWETLAFQDSKAAENAARERAGFRGGLYIEQQRKVANNALDAAQKETERAFDAEMKRRGAQGAKAQKLLESMGGQEVTKGVLKSYLAALNDPDPVVAAKFLQATASMSNWKRATVVRLAGLVSSPITMMVNIGGNAASALYEVPTHVLAGGIDALRVAAAGGERQIYGGDILSMAKAYGPGFLGQLDNAKRILTTGFTPEQLADPKKIRGAFSRWGGLNTAVEAPLRVLGASDALFRGGAMAAHGTRVAMRQARAEGFSGPQVSGRAATILKNLEDYPELAKEAADATARQVYQERRPVLGGGNQGMQNDIAEFATKQFLPFYQTPMNVTAQGVAMSPLGGVAALQSARKAAGMATGTLAERTARGSEIRLAEERAARALIGTGVLGAGIALGSAGHLTGAYPIDQKEASTLPQGWRPWSVRVDSPIDGNTYYVPLQNFNAAGFPLAMAAILTDPQHRNKTLADPDEQLNAVTAIGRYVLDNTFLQGLSDVVNTLHDPKTFAQKTGEGLAASYGPYSSLGREFQRVTGVATRNPREGFLGLWQAMEANYPGASGQVPASQTPLGDERTQAATGIGRALPLRYDIERDEPTLKVLREHGVGIPPLQKAVSAGTGLSIKLTEDEQAQLQQQQGALIRQYVTDAQSDKRWAKYTDNDKAAVLKNSVAAAQRSARAQFLDKLGDAEVLKRREAKPGPEPYYLGAGAAS